MVLEDMTMGNYTFSLFNQPSFVEGLARILDFGDTLSEYNLSLTPQQADFHAIRSDWLAVGDDLRAAAASLKYVTSKR